MGRSNQPFGTSAALIRVCERAALPSIPTPNDATAPAPVAICRKSRRVNTPRYYLKEKRAQRTVAEAPDARYAAGAGYGNVSGRTRTAVVTFKGYRPAVGNVSSTNAALQPCGGARRGATHVLGPT